MRTRIVEVTNGPKNWGKMLLAQFEPEEWATPSAIIGRHIDGRTLGVLDYCGWSRTHLLVLDLQTGEGALFRPGGSASADLAKHRIWVCPLFEPFLTWLYTQPDPWAIPAHVDLPDAPFAWAGHRRPGPPMEAPIEEDTHAPSDPRP
jgi:hypothetical protein